MVDNIFNTLTLPDLEDKEAVRLFLLEVIKKLRALEIEITKLKTNS